MGRVTRVQTIEAVAKEIGENLELIEVISMNYDNIDDGEMIWIENGGSVKDLSHIFSGDGSVG